MKQRLLVLCMLLLLRCTPHNNDYLLAFNDEDKQQSGYTNTNGDTLILSKNYLYCFTDTFRNYAVVTKKDIGFVAINRKEEVLYQVFAFDNGPDTAVEGLFRIAKNNKIGYADQLTGEIVIKPQFACAFPFEGGKAKVSIDCEIKTEGEHHSWQSNHWFYIDKQGLKTEP